MRRMGYGMPQGEHVACKACGGLVIIERTEESLVVHHAQPYCAEFLATTEQAEFTTLAAVDADEAAAAVSAVKN